MDLSEADLCVLSKTMARVEKESAFKSQLHLWQFCLHLGYYRVPVFQKLTPEVYVWVIMSFFDC